MTVSSTTVKNSYSGNGSNDTFVYGFKIFADTDLEVIIRSALGVETIKTLTTHYTVTNAGSASGGNVVFTSGNIPTATETVVVRREVPQTQAIDYIANDPFPAESHEEGLDRATMTIQQLQEEVNRSIKLSATNTMTSTEFTVGATDRANKVLSFDASGEIAIAQELGTFKGDSATTTTAAYVVRDIVKGTTAAQLNNIYICIQASPVGTALTNTSYWVLIVDAVSAATSATAAASSATTSGNSATASANSATASANSATTSGNSATASANSATASANSATAAAASADAFDDIYLGTKSSDPSTDNDGDALAAGMLYFNSTNNILRVYSGSAWQDAAISATGVVTLTGTQTLTNKTLTSPKINENVAVTSTATELNLLDGLTGVIPGKFEGTNFSQSILVGQTTTGTLNAAVRNVGIGGGGLTLSALTTGDNNIGIGFTALRNITGGSNNIAIGSDALTSTSGGTNNVAVGLNTLRIADGSTTENTAIGNAAGIAVTSGNVNTFLGNNAGSNISSGSGNVIIGEVTADSATGDRQLKIAGHDGSTTTTWISGDNSGNVSVPANLNLSGSNKELRFYEGANYVGFEAPALSADKIWVLPAADGSADQVLKTDGSGNLGFANAGGGVNTPYFYGELASAQTITRGATTKITGMTNDEQDSATAFDGTTFTVPSGQGGRYYIEGVVTASYADIGQDGEETVAYIYKGGAEIKQATIRTSSSVTGTGRTITTVASGIFNLSASDTIELYATITDASGGNGNATANRTSIAGYKLIE